MRITWFFIAAILLVSNAPVEDVFVIKEKEIRVKGVTSIGRFECAYGNEELSDTLFTGISSRSKQLDFIIPVDQFGCGNFMLNRDFRSTIKAEEFPVCRVTVRSLTRQRDVFVSDLDVDLAGKSLFLDDVVFRYETNKLTGEVDLSFDLLDLVPPKKLGGLIQVEDKLSLQIIMGM